MTNISLATYTIRIWDRQEAKYVKLDSFTKGADFLDVLERYLQSRQTYLPHDKENQTLLRVQICNRIGRAISGKMEKGEYGYQSRILNVVRETDSYIRLTDDAEMLPFYFHLEIPKNANEGIAAFQRLGQFGFKEFFEYDLREYLAEEYGDFRVDMYPLVPQRLIREYVNRGRVTKVRFVQYGIPTDIADRFDSQQEEKEGVIELRLSAKRGQEIPLVSRVREVLDGNRDVNNFLELKNFEYDNVKVEMTVGNSRRTLNLLHPYNIRANYDVTVDVKYGEDGHPLFESIDEIARELVEEAMKQMGTGEYHVQQD